MGGSDEALDLAALRAAYGRFLAGGRVLLTGHSHQAWPDVARDAMDLAFDEAARFVDDKWSESIFPRIDAVGRGILTRLGFDPGDAIAFGKSTHELVTRLLTCFPAQREPVVVTTTAEFHSLYRQLHRLAEEGFRVTWVDAADRASLADRMLEAIKPGTSVVAISAVLFEDAFIVPRLGEIAQRAVEVGAIPLIDAYHAFNAVPIDWGPAKEHLYVTAGGYKYAALGEGVCFLRIPRGTTLRPVDTGWFSDFAALEGERSSKVGYGPGGARFSGASFDATPFYRAQAVLAHWERFGLDVPALRAISLRQTRRIIARLDDAGLGDRVASSRADERRGAFVSVRTPHGHDVVQRLRGRGVFTDARGDLLRLGPAPYLTNDEIDAGTSAAAEEIAKILRENDAALHR
ncbi:aminotransferase class V-fold PLP-dependent enzyme [Polyangium aurulentum]|uniref:aminotransferase class V-fold PLP-dependent enzyme n=1 Tax=Polyangium aurulentum TaxID=2567896 RepID=UPI0010AE1F4C|nr:aminotransferase class V-fold PLP-dependent enzyme [Polyangium aurulentum]UQA57384.1 aminotransferase class V-fold PLP-dependent enzyme [Polyangium aurulentum]